jgi:hypothetical protein
VPTIIIGGIPEDDPLAYVKIDLSQKLIPPSIDKKEDEEPFSSHKHC